VFSSIHFVAVFLSAPLPITNSCKLIISNAVKPKRIQVQKFEHKNVLFKENKTETTIDDMASRASFLIQLFN